LHDCVFFRECGRFRLGQTLSLGGEAVVRRFDAGGAKEATSGPQESGATRDLWEPALSDIRPTLEEPLR
jgi:hypothetical protein